MKTTAQSIFPLSTLLSLMERTPVGRVRGISTGFTLIEIVTVAAVLGALSYIGLVMLDPFGQIQKANDARRKNDLAQLQRGLEAYYADNNKYPANPGMPQDTIDPNCEHDAYTIAYDQDIGIAWGADAADTENFLPYMNPLPEDKSPRTYAYFVTCDRQAYYLYANLQRADLDEQACNGGMVCESIGSGSNIGMDTEGHDCRVATSSDATIICNYAVSSPNVVP